VAEALDTPFDRPRSGFNNLGLDLGRQPTAAPFCRPDLLAISETCFPFTASGRGVSSRAVSSDQAPGERHRPLQITVLWCLGRIGHAEALAGSRWPVHAWARESVWFVARLTPVLMADPVADRVAALPTGLARSGGGAFFPRRFVNLKLRAVVVRNLLVPSVSAISGSAYQVQRMWPCRWQEAWKRRRSPNPLAVLARAGPCWRIQKPAATAWTSERRLGPN